MSYLIEYIGKCRRGDEIIGKDLMLMLDILDAYITNKTVTIDDGNHEVWFDTAESDLRIRFIESNCKHYEAPFAGKPFILTLRQKAYIEAFYSFKIYDDEIGRKVRLFQERLHLVARKCGKTPLEAAMDLAEWFCGEWGTKILCSSNDYEQADLMFQSINAMREESPLLERATRKNIKGIYFGNPKKPKKRGKFSYQNKGSIRKISAKTGAKEGKNIKIGSVDEGHELKDDSSIMPIRQALSTQDEPIFSEITTEGFVRGGYLDGRLIEARKVLKGELHRPRWLIWLHTQDNEAEIWQDEKSWLKSNPDLGTIKKWRFLRQMVDEARTNSATRAFVLAKDFNLPQSSVVAWLQESEIINQSTFRLEDFTGSFYLGGHDFAETTDLCATCLLFMKPGDTTIYLWPQFWIPEIKLEKSPDNVDYETWARDGYLQIVPGNYVDSAVVADWQFDLLTNYDIKPLKSGYDNRFAKSYISRLSELFDEFIPENVPQDAKCLNNVMHRLEADLKGKLVNYNNCYGMQHCLRNTGFKLDSIGRMMPCKLEATKRIDGTAAALCCYAMLDWHRSEFMNLIEG